MPSPMDLSEGPALEGYWTELKDARQILRKKCTERITHRVGSLMRQTGRRSGSGWCPDDAARVQENSERRRSRSDLPLKTLGCWPCYLSKEIAEHLSNPWRRSLPQLGNSDPPSSTRKPARQFASPPNLCVESIELKLSAECGDPLNVFLWRYTCMSLRTFCVRINVAGCGQVVKDFGVQ